MDRKLTNGALELLDYLLDSENIKGKYFNFSNLYYFCSATGQSDEEALSYLDELVDFKLVNKARQFMGGFKYSLNIEEIESFLSKREELEEEEFEKETIYTQEYRDALDEEIRQYRKFVITTAVMGKEINKPFVEAIRNYAERNNALLLVLPCEDIASRGKKAAPIELDSELRDFRVVFKDTYINENLCLSAIKVSAKQINPLTGLDRLAMARNASIIVASPKVFLKYVPNMKNDIPPAIMTTGAITENNYDNDKYMSKRTSVLAENDHTYGAVIVEVEDDSAFHFRHVKASPYNSLTDMGIDYLPDGSINSMENTVMVLGDSHTGYHDEELHFSIMEVARNLGVKAMVLHDIFNGTSISHHDLNKGITKAKKAERNELSLELECVAVKNYLWNIKAHNIETYIVDSNHDKHLLRYLEEGRYVSDPINHKFSLKLANAAMENENPLQYAIEKVLNYKNNTTHWLGTDESCKFYGVECGIHGSKGANGGKGSLATYEKCVGNCVVAHTHSAAILRNAFSVGTTSLLDLGYNEGLSNWTRTCCLIYSNGTKQLINFIPQDNSYSCRI